MLECACGTGLLSAVIAEKCRQLTATDFSEKMLKKAEKNCRSFCNITYDQADITSLPFADGSFDKVVAGNVIHLLEVPVGTGVLTMPVYRDLPDADITCLDYSENMMASAQEKAKVLGLSNIKFLQGDVGALPFEDESFDIVLSLNGFHAFPDKEAAYRETCRVLKPGGTFCGCFYVQGGHKRTDWFIRRGRCLPSDYRQKHYVALFYCSFPQKALIFLSLSALSFVFGSIRTSSASKSLIPIADFSFTKAFSAPEPL